MAQSATASAVPGSSNTQLSAAENASKKVPVEEALLPYEEWWISKRPLLERRGYMLRPRYQPGWIPSWRGTNSKWYQCEDSHHSLHPNTIDAIRLSDNTPVCIKRADVKTYESFICMYLSSPPCAGDAENHAVPLLDYIVDDPEYNFLIMPLLRRFDDPPFMYIDEVVEFFKQTLEGLVFLHRNGVAHRDCSDLNIMLDASSMYPDGFHPVIQTAARDAIHDAHFVQRANAPSVKYYFTDFGISSHFPNAEEQRLVTGIQCQDREVPELSKRVPYDPFKTDIFILGNVFRRKFIKIYRNVSFLQPLVYNMTVLDPVARPTADEALAQFHQLVAKQFRLALHWRLIDKRISPFDRIGRGVHSLYRVASRNLNHLSYRRLFFPAASTSLLALAYGPRNILNRIRELFQRH